jgi:hypothetical protein
MCFRPVGAVRTMSARMAFLIAFPSGLDVLCVLRLRNRRFLLLDEDDESSEDVVVASVLAGSSLVASDVAANVVVVVVVDDVLVAGDTTEEEEEEGDDSPCTLERLPDLVPRNELIRWRRSATLELRVRRIVRAGEEGGEPLEDVDVAGSSQRGIGRSKSATECRCDEGGESGGEYNCVEEPAMGDEELCSVDTRRPLPLRMDFRRCEWAPASSAIPVPARAGDVTSEASCADVEGGNDEGIRGEVVALTEAKSYCVGSGVTGIPLGLTGGEAAIGASCAALEEEMSCAASLSSPLLERR